MDPQISTNQQEKENKETTQQLPINKQSLNQPNLPQNNIQQNIGAKNQQQQTKQLQKNSKVQQNSNKTSPNKQQALVYTQNCDKVQSQNSQLKKSIMESINILNFEKKQENRLKITKMDITIKIQKSKQKGFGLSKHTYYQIIGQDQHGPIQIKRRTGQFQALRKILLQRWPGCFIPQISDRTDAKSEETKKTHKQKNLQGFLMKIARYSFIYYKQQVQIFLRSEGIDAQEMFTEMPVLKVDDIIERLKYSFDEDVLKSSAEWASRIAKFSTSLKKISKNIGNIAKKMLKLAQYHQIYARFLPKVGQILKNYEKNCLAQYTDRTPQQCIIMKREQDIKLQKLESLLKTHNIFYDLYFLLEGQARDADSLLQIILAMEMFTKKRQQYQRKSKQTRIQIDQLSLGNSSTKLTSGKKTKQELLNQLEIKQKNFISNKHQISELYSLAEAILANHTIQVFKAMKKQSYIILLAKWAQLAEDTNAQIFQVWKCLKQEAVSLHKQII